MRRTLPYFLMLLLTAYAAHADTTSSSSDWDASYSHPKGYDNSDKSTWCAAKTSPASHSFSNRLFNDWWQVEFTTPKSVGSIYMRSGWYDTNKGMLNGFKVRNFVWAYQTEGTTSWVRIPETDMYAARYQLVFRFSPIQNVKRMRLYIMREPDELLFTGSDAPCLREATFYPTQSEKIDTTPWIASVSLPENEHAFKATDWKGGCLTSQMKETVIGIQSTKDVDLYDTFWVGEFNKEKVLGVIGSDDKPLTGSAGATDSGPGRKLIVDNKRIPIGEFRSSTGYSSWIMHEPRPSGLILSGTHLEWDQVNPYLLAGLYNYINENYRNIAILGICGGHQYLVQQFTHPTFEDFKTEFTTDNINQNVVTCINLPYIAQGVNAKDPRFVDIFQNPENPIQMGCGQYGWIDLQILNTDPLFYNVDNRFNGRLMNRDSVNWENKAVSDRFDLLVTYLDGHTYNYADKATSPSTYKETNYHAPAQSIKLKGYPIYGTQFHPDYACGAVGVDTVRIVDGPNDWKNSLQILRNFALISYNQGTSIPYLVPSLSINSPLNGGTGPVAVPYNQPIHFSATAKSGNGQEVNHFQWWHNNGVSCPPVKAGTNYGTILTRTATAHGTYGFNKTAKEFGAGIHKIDVWASASGIEGISGNWACKTVTIEVLPQLAINSPSNNSKIPLANDIVFTATGNSDIGQTVKQYQWWINNGVSCPQVVTGANYGTKFKEVSDAPGTYSFSKKASDFGVGKQKVDVWANLASSDTASKWVCQTIHFEVIQPTSLPPPSFSITGVQSGSQTVSLSTTISGASIHFTNDGTNPTAASQKYVSPFSVTGKKVIKAMTAKTGYANSEVAIEAIMLDCIHAADKECNGCVDMNEFIIYLDRFKKENIPLTGVLEVLKLYKKGCHSEPYCHKPSSSSNYQYLASELGSTAELSPGWFLGAQKGAGIGLLYKSTNQIDVPVETLFGANSMYGCANQVESVWHYDFSKGTWSAFFPGNPGMSDLSLIRNGEIYSINMKGACILKHPNQGSFWKSEACPKECIMGICV